MKVLELIDIHNLVVIKKFNHIELNISICNSLHKNLIQKYLKILIMNSIE